MSYHKVMINMEELSDIVNQHNMSEPQIIFEIGSLHGNDMQILKEKYPKSEIHIVEAHPEYSKKIKLKYPSFNVYEFAATNENKTITFNGVNDEITNKGISSIHERKNVNYTKYEVQGRRMDSFLKETNIEKIDIIKIDVEGHSFEVLEGFGEFINKIKCIHIENEHISVWDNQKLYCDVEEFLIKNGFILTSIKAAWPQTDSVWIRRDCYIPKWWK